MGLPILAHEARPVHAHDHRQLLEADVVAELVHGSLQEGRIDGRHGLQALRRHAGGHGEGVLLGDAYVEGALRELVKEGAKARAVPHGGGDGHDAIILLR